MCDLACPAPYTSITFTRPIHVVAWAGLSLHFTAAYYSIVWMDYIWFIHSSVTGCLDYFPLGATVNSATLNIQG